MKRTESFQGDGFGKPRIKPFAGGNDEGADLMSGRVFVNYNELITKSEVEVGGDNVDVVSRTETYRRSRWDSDHVLFRLWLTDNTAEGHATDHHSRRCNDE